MAVFALPRTEASDMLPRYISMRPSAAGFTTALNSPDLSPNRVYIEFVLTGTLGNTLSSLYSSTEEPNQVLADQIPYYYKPVPTIQRREFEFLRGEVKRISGIKDPRLYKNYFARDINAKLYGYGSTCPCCGYESKMINSFMLKNFSIGLLNDEGKEQKFRFSLYLCANDSYAAGGWIIDDVSIGGMSPFLWLEELSQIDYIPPEFLICRIKST